MPQRPGRLLVLVLLAAAAIGPFPTAPAVAAERPQAPDAGTAVTPTVVPGAPSAPTTLTAKQVAKGQVSATWGTPTVNGGTELTYLVSVDGTLQAIVSSNSATIAGLPSGTREVSVVARNGDGDGPAANDLGVPPGPPP